MFTLKSSSSDLSIFNFQFATRAEAAAWAHNQAKADAMSWGLGTMSIVEHIFDSQTSIEDADGCGIVGYRIMKLTHIQATIYRREEIGTVMIEEI